MAEPVRPNSASLPVNDPPSDHTLVRFVRGGDQSAAEELYHRYASRLRRLVSERCSIEFDARFDADDIVQSVFRVLYEGMRTKFYDVPQGGELWSLLFVLAVNKLRDQVSFHKAAKRSVRRTAPADDRNPDNLFGHDESTAALLRLVVEEYLNKLPESERAIIALRMTGHSVDEVAEQTGRAKRTVERVLQKARDRLTDLLRP